MHPTPRGTGWIEVITGSMFSGKSEELIRRLRRAEYARQRIAVFKPALDDRFGAAEIVSRAAGRLASHAVRSAADIPALAADAEVVGIDEAQFLGPDLVAVCERLADAGKRVIVAGLDQDFRGRPFEPIPDLMAVAEYVTKELAICVVCGNPANRSQRIVARDSRIVVGDTDAYEARCRRCFSADPPGVPLQSELGLDPPAPSDDED
ncbi:MAG TPA: thymidine kinase [Myxococcota bacterium]|nr:thymidine kinase [Myxococcota bacterium]